MAALQHDVIPFSSLLELRKPDIYSEGLVAPSAYGWDEISVV